jgi:hypothetical protein
MGYPFAILALSNLTLVPLPSLVIRMPLRHDILAPEIRPPRAPRRRTLPENGQTCWVLPTSRFGLAGSQGRPRNPVPKYCPARSRPSIDQPKALWSAFGYKFSSEKQKQSSLSTAFCSPQSPTSRHWWLKDALILHCFPQQLHARKGISSTGLRPIR